MISMVTRRELDVTLALPLVKRLDVVNARAFAAHARGVVAAPRTAILDLSLVQQVDCRGVETLLELARAAAASGGALILAGLASHLVELIELAGIGSLLPSFATLTAARAGLGTEVR